MLGIAFRLTALLGVSYSMFLTILFVAEKVLVLKFSLWESLLWMAVASLTGAFLGGVVSYMESLEPLRYRDDKDDPVHFLMNTVLFQVETTRMGRISYACCVTVVFLSSLWLYWIYSLLTTLIASFSFIGSSKKGYQSSLRDGY